MDHFSEMGQSEIGTVKEGNHSQRTLWMCSSYTVNNYIRKFK